MAFFFNFGNTTSHQIQVETASIVKRYNHHVTRFGDFKRGKATKDSSSKKNEKRQL